VNHIFKNTSKVLAITSLFFCAIFFAANSWAIPNLKSGTKDSNLSSILKADEVHGDQVSKVLVATGHAELSKGMSVIYADEMLYDKNGKMVRAIGNVKVKNLEIGNMFATKGEMKEDFSSGSFFDTKMIFSDGSYLTSPRVDRETAEITVLRSSVFSICPNDEIVADNSFAGEKRDFVSIKSSKTTIDRHDSVMKMNNGILRVYNVPVLYTPYFRTALQSKKRQTGFLQPSYVKSTNLGLGLKTPFYWAIDESKELTVTPFIGLTSKQIMLNNEYHEISTYGEYKLNLEVANNELSSNANNNSTVVQRSNKQYRWNSGGRGIFDFDTNIGADYILAAVGDRNYLRDYYFNYLNYTTSKANFDYIKERDYYAIKTIKIQELEDKATEDEAPLVLPSIDTHTETKPQSYKEKYVFSSNTTVITRADGLQYRRASAVPEVSLPFNINGNLFNFDSKVQGDVYSLENNFKQNSTNNFDKTLVNYKPEASLNWKLPLIRKGSFNSVMIEPMANIVISSYGRNFNKVPNEDSNSSELTVSNLFVNDRIAGYDRNESGTRLSLGVKSSLFNEYGNFALTIGQSYKKGGEQDVQIKGFGINDKSNFVGQATYKTKKYFSFYYSFQLNESNYRNDVNQFTANLNFERLTFSTNYLLLRKNSQNLTEAKQLSFDSTFKFNDKWNGTLAVAKDLVLDRVLSRSATINYIGCCAIVGFSVIENNPSSLTKPQRTFNVNFSFKNL